MLTYSPKGYTSVTVGVSPTACNKASYEHPKWCYIGANKRHKRKQGSNIITKVAPLRVLALPKL